MLGPSGSQTLMEFLSRQARRPSFIWRPHLAKDGNMWSALYGDNIQEGVCGFGKTPEEAMLAFDKAWVREVGSAVNISPREEAANDSSL